MALENLIYDRTEGDAERWLYLSRKLDTEGWAELTAAEKREWLTQLKGAYNYTDMNRVGSAVEYLGERFTSLITHLIEYRALPSPGTRSFHVNRFIGVSYAPLLYSARRRGSG